MYLKTKEIGWEENHGIQKHWHQILSREYNNRSENGMKIWENYNTKLYDRANQPEHLEVKPEEEVAEDKKSTYVLQSEVGKAIMEMRDKKATGDDDVPGDVLRLLGEDGLKLMTQFVNSIYVTGEWSEGFT
jgi:hypothetical protein